jgi:hypothetical protein
VHLVWCFFSKKRTCQAGAPGDLQVTHVIEGAPGLSIRRTWAKKKRACKSAHRAWVSSNHQPDPPAHMYVVEEKQSGPYRRTCGQAKLALQLTDRRTCVK